MFIQSQRTYLGCQNSQLVIMFILVLSKTLLCQGSGHQSSAYSMETYRWPVCFLSTQVWMISHQKRHKIHVSFSPIWILQRNHALLPTKVKFSPLFLLLIYIVLLCLGFLLCGNRLGHPSTFCCKDCYVRL